jgi:hypothetical protein
MYIYIYNLTQPCFYCISGYLLRSLDHHQASAIHNLKRLVTCIAYSVQCQAVWDPIYIIVNIFY